MITTKRELNEIIRYEKYKYSDYMFPSRIRFFMAGIKQEPIKRILKWQLLSRKTDFYKYRINNQGHLFDKISYLYYICLRNRMAEKIGIDIGTENIGKGLLLYHYGATVINGNSIIGENCHLHGNNCIGNNGSQDLHCPVIGNNVMLGVGAKVIGNVIIANNIKIAAGAVVVHSFLEEGITIGGIPAKKIK